MSKSDAAKPTPGPWKVYTTPDGRTLIGIGDASGTGLVDRFGAMWGDPQEALANAAHIARFNPQTAEAMVALMDTLKAAIAADGLPKGWGLVQERLDAALLKLAEPTP